MNGNPGFGAFAEMAEIAFDRETRRIVAVWQKARRIPSRNPALVRQDDFGREIHFADYGNAESPTGWQIDRRFRLAMGWADRLWNLRPRHCG